MLKKIALISLAPLTLAFAMSTTLNASAKELKPVKEQTSQIQTKSREGKMSPSREVGTKSREGKMTHSREISNKSSETKRPTHKVKHRASRPSTESQSLHK